MIEVILSILIRKKKINICIHYMKLTLKHCRLWHVHYFLLWKSFLTCFCVYRTLHSHNDLATFDIAVISISYANDILADFLYLFIWQLCVLWALLMDDNTSMAKVIESSWTLQLYTHGNQLERKCIEDKQHTKAWRRFVNLSIEVPQP